MEALQADDFDQEDVPEEKKEGPPASIYPEGKIFTDAGVYNAPEGALKSGMGAFSSLVNTDTATKGTSVDRWTAMQATAKGYENLHGRVEEASGKKSVPKVKFVRSGKRWGFFVG